MKNLTAPTLTLLSLSLAFCGADTWTSVNGEKLEGEFVGYSASTETISIERAYDGRVFAIPETELIHADRIKAIRLQIKDIPDYWHTDYAEAKAENPDKRYLILYRNGAKAEYFERFCIQLLLRESFIRLLKSRGVIVCIPEAIPDEIGLITIRNRDGTVSRTIRIGEDRPRNPFAFVVDFAAEKRINDRIFRAKLALFQPPADPNPFLERPENSPYIEVEAIDKYIRRLSRP